MKTGGPLFARVVPLTKSNILNKKQETGFSLLFFYFSCGKLIASVASTRAPSSFLVLCLLSLAIPAVVATLQDVQLVIAMLAEDGRSLGAGSQPLVIHVDGQVRA